LTFVHERTDGPAQAQLRRMIRQHPLGFLRFVAKSIRLEFAARRRRP
jgi:hypothetical protein